MDYILHIETTTRVCSAGLSVKGQLLAIREENSREYAHSSMLTPFVEEVIKEAGIKMQDLSAVAVSEGPGSYTGLRIGVSAAKGLCYALDIPLIALDTMQAMANHCRQQIQDEPIVKKTSPDKLFYCPMIDARRMEVYFAVFDQAMKKIRPTQATIITEESFKDFPHDAIILFFGDGASKCKEVISHPGKVFPKEVLPSVKGMVKPAHEKFTARDFADVAYFEPFYLKDFVAGKPKVKGLSG